MYFTLVKYIHFVVWVYSTRVEYTQNFEHIFRAVEPFFIENFTKEAPKASAFKAPFFKQDPVEIALCEDLARRAHSLVEDGEDTETFWIRLHNIKIGDEFKFRRLTTGVIKMLVLPISNAEVERTFSVTKYLKDWRRSRTSTTLLRNMLFIKFGLKWNGLRASQFKPPRKLLEFNSSIYD